MNLVKLTPIMKQYLDIKSNYLDFLLFYQMGDFYELFYDDAKKVSSLLNITLTKRCFVNQGCIPMAGIPISSSKNYILRLIKLGESVAICDQDKFKNNLNLSKKLIDRKVTRIYTPGTISEDSFLNYKKDNLISCVFGFNNIDRFGFSTIDIFSGRFNVFELYSLDELKYELLCNNPVEIIYPENFFRLSYIKSYSCIKSKSLNYFDFNRTYNYLLKFFNILNLSCFGILNDFLCIRSAGCLLEYVNYTQFIKLKHIKKIKFNNFSKKIFIDCSTIRNLEIVDSLYGNNKNTVLFVLDKTLTPMGSRMLRRWLLCPLKDINEINRRHSIIDFISIDYIGIRKILLNIGDLERILGRISLKTATLFDLFNLKKYIFFIIDLCFWGIKKGRLYFFDYINSNLNILKNIVSMLDKSIVNINDTDFINNGFFILPGFNKKLDYYRKINMDNSIYLKDIENKERIKTGIKSLYIRYNRKHGYYVQINKSESNLVPNYYIRYQTLKYIERYTFLDLKKYESKIIYAKQKMFFLEKIIFNDILDVILLDLEILRNISNYVAQLDVLSTFVERSNSLNYVKPKFVSNSIFKLKKGRHPVLESFLDLDFVSNDLFFDDFNRLLVITGPNMGGKSTYMRQIAIICIMAYIGCYVPADSLVIGFVDKIFTRIGFSDDINSGKSTFMVEMSEVSNILNSATKNSLILIDELGRGTSINDGISLAWSCLDYIVNNIGCMTLFSTHFLELTNMCKFVNGIKNVYLDFYKDKDNVILLYKVKDGICNNSYGINIASKVGFPKSVVKSSFNKLKELSFFNIFIKDYKKYIFLRDSILKLDLENISIFDLIKEIKNLKNIF